MAKYFLGKFLTGKATESEIADAASLARIDPEDFDDNLEKGTYGLVLSKYGPEKEAEVQEALEIATKRDLRDIARYLQMWLANRRVQAVSGLAALGRQGLGSRSTADTESLVGKFLTGEKGSLPTQLEALKRKATTGMGGRRKTRRRKTRNAKKSRRTYK